MIQGGGRGGEENSCTQTQTRNHVDTQTETQTRVYAATHITLDTCTQTSTHTGHAHTSTHMFSCKNKMFNPISLPPLFLSVCLIIVYLSSFLTLALPLPIYLCLSLYHSFSLLLSLIFQISSSLTLFSSSLFLSPYLCT